jgi:hypothetical protein
MTTTSLTTRRLGQQSTWTAVFEDDEGNRINPSTVVFQWRRKSQATATVFTFGEDSEVVSPSTGVFEFTSPKYQHAEVHYVRCVSTGPATANESSVNVDRSVFAEASA